ncbi:MAG TPA: alpha/beta hydrolase family protein [Acidobacteriota bacterium]|nr:alpha/beta hydrolase family protein [Acidobacteriota bacterium]
MAQWVRTSRFGMLMWMIIGIGGIGSGVIQFLKAQFNDERRRTDLNPIVLPGGSTVEFKSFESQMLGAQERYSIFLPPSFSKDAARTYPVIYFLHGLNNDETSWTVDRYGNIQNVLDQMIGAKKIPELIMVHPRGDSSFYCNYLDGSKRYEDLITQELINYMETNYRAARGRENRAIAGTSMGGYGALKIAMKYPDRYAAVVGQSPILFPGSNPLALSEEAKASRFYSFFINMLKPIFGDPVRQDLWDANNPLVLAKNRKLDGLKIYFDYGTDDRYIPMTHLDEGSKALDQILTEARVPHTFKIHPGEPHGWALISAHLDDTLPFLSGTFKK